MPYSAVERQLCACCRPLVPGLGGDDEYDDIVSGVKTISRQEGVGMDVVFQGGKPSEAIIDVAYKKGNDLIVIGKTDMSSLGKLVMGSIAMKVAMNSDRPVFIIKP